MSRSDYLHERVTEKTVDSIFKMLYLSNVREAADSLLAGNDTQCFTSAEFKERYVKQCNERLRSPLSSKNPIWTVDIMTQASSDKEAWGSRMLTNAGYIQIKPDVWTKEVI